MKECPVCHRCFADRLNHCPSDGEALKHLFAGDPVIDGRYQLDKKIGHGGMGMVFKARHVHLKTTHAVKVILPDLVGNDPTLVTRFRQEAMAAAAIRHPHTVSVTDYGVINETTPYLVMEFVEGRSLHDLLAERKRLPAPLAVEITLAVCEGVAAAHRAGVVHRDLKPLNILLKDGESPRDGVKVLDFGLAKIKSGELLGSFVAAQTQGLMGSPFYMAPEQWSDEGVDERADIYSLGVLLYQMVAGDVPFKGASIPSIMNKHLTAPPAPFSERGVGVPQAVEAAVRHALEKEPSRRPPTVAAFMDELRAALASLASATAPTLVGGRTIQHPPQPTAELPDGRGVSTGAESGVGLGVGPPADEGIVETGAGARGRASAPETEAGARTAAEPPAVATDAMASRPGGEPADSSPAFEVYDAGGARGDRGSGPLEWSEVEARWRRVVSEERARREAEEGTNGREAAAGVAAFSAHSTPPAAPPSPAAARQIMPGVEDVASAPPSVSPSVSSSRLPILAAGAAVLLLLIIGVGGLAYYLITRDGAGNENGRAENANATANTNGAEADANRQTNANAGSAASDAGRPQMVSLPGGSFRMGRDDVPPLTDEAKRERPTYMLWMYQQWPARRVAVAPFAIDKTEVTNGEYAEFVRETGREAPAGWGGDAPPAGFERLPVTGVSYEDARAFAAWRSRRDGVAYRLPTEEEWEYAARGGGDDARLFPWGAEWSAGYANLSGAGAAPVGSFPLGATPQGVEDMIGNVWELTASAAKMYEGNNQTVLSQADRGKVVTRGGSYESRPDGDEPITATARRWVAKDFRSPVLGFRLARPER
jgi:serine/threonine protein kinase/formylglycine-generating enzyme required for sulfatase activity